MIKVDGLDPLHEFLHAGLMHMQFSWWRQRKYRCVGSRNDNECNKAYVFYAAKWLIIWKKEKRDPMLAFKSSHSKLLCSIKYTHLTSLNVHPIELSLFSTFKYLLKAIWFYGPRGSKIVFFVFFFPLPAFLLLFLSYYSFYINSFVIFSFLCSLISFSSRSCFVIGPKKSLISPA